MVHFLTALLAITLLLGAGFVATQLFAQALHNKYFPWVSGRALGIAGYLALTALVALGLGQRHRWR